MTSKITAWYLEGVDEDAAPRSFADLKRRFKSVELSTADLIGLEKWEPLIAGNVVQERPGWVQLGDLARTRRGIATGSNDFFLLSAGDVKRHGISRKNITPCVGKSSDVRFARFSTEDFSNIELRGGRCFLLEFGADLNVAERRYIESGERAGLPCRNLLAARTPWYSMEKREPSPIWATVFGRGRIGFVRNDANVKSLTNFHCVIPIESNPVHIDALTLVLNSQPVLEASRAHKRGYGGGLGKFEPKDLKSIPIPDLRLVSEKTLKRLASMFDQLNISMRSGANQSVLQKVISAAVIGCGVEASENGHSTRLL